MITLEQYDQIRRMYYLEEKSGRHIAKELGLSRQTVTRALRLDQPTCLHTQRATAGTTARSLLGSPGRIADGESPFAQKAALHRPQAVSVGASRRLQR